MCRPSIRSYAVEALIAFTAPMVFLARMRTIFVLFYFIVLVGQIIVNVSESILFVANLSMEFLFLFSFLDFWDFVISWLFLIFVPLQLRPLLLDIWESFIPELDSSRLLCALEEVIKHIVDVINISIIIRELLPYMRLRTFLSCYLRVRNLSSLSWLALGLGTWTLMSLFFALRPRLLYYFDFSFMHGSLRFLSTLCAFHTYMHFCRPLLLFLVHLP